MTAKKTLAAVAAVALLSIPTVGIAQTATTDDSAPAATCPHHGQDMAQDMAGVPLRDADHARLHAAHMAGGGMTSMMGADAGMGYGSRR